MKSIASSAAIVLLTAVAAQAQAPQTLESVNAYAGRTVIVHELSGAIVRGRLIQATNRDIAMSVNGLREVVDVDIVQSVGVVGDSIKNGVLIGLGVGALFTVLGHSDVSGCSKPCFSDSALSQALGVAAIGAIGGWIDARHTRERVVYEKP